MSVNGVTTPSQTSAYSYTQKAAATDSAVTEEAKKSTTENNGAVYEPSKETTTESTKKTYKRDTNLINKHKADADARTQQLRSLVEQMMSKQTNTYGKANNIFRFLAKGDYTVDAATKLQAQKDISEDGYWGVEQTSDRIISFANGLTGGNPDKIEEMRSAFLKGYKQAEKTWGGKLPDISKRTYDAVIEKFDKLAEEAKKVSDPTKAEQ